MVVDVWKHLPFFESDCAACLYLLNVALMRSISIEIFVC